MPQPQPLPQPQNYTLFDPWNSSSTGHQRAESPSNNAQWRRLRTDKLAHQFDQRRNSTGECPVPASSATATGCRDIRSYFGVGKRKRKRPLVDIDTNAEIDIEKNTKRTCPNPPVQGSKDAAHVRESEMPKIFTGTSIYINGSTAPTISDHRLKHLLVSHGAALSLWLARRTVTHVVVGRPVSPSPATTASVSNAGGAGAGGGLAAGKLQKEIERCGRQVKVVCVEWLVSSFLMLLRTDTRLVGHLKVSKLANGCPRPGSRWVWLRKDSRVCWPCLGDDCTIR